MDALWMTSPNSAEETQGDRILLGYVGDHLCKCSTTGRAIALQKKAIVFVYSLEQKQGDKILFGYRDNYF
jgi:hypothetical protein